MAEGLKAVFSAVEPLRKVDNCGVEGRFDAVCESAREGKNVEEVDELGAEEDAGSSRRVTRQCGCV